MKKKAARSTPPSTRSRRLELAILVLGVAGVLVALQLMSVHARGSSPLCDFSAGVSCSAVAASVYSTALGVPLAAWGGLVYLAVVGLAATALGRSRPHPGFPAGILVVLTGLMSAVAVVLAFISHFLIGSLCIFCVVSWLISFALLACSWRLAGRAGGAKAALRSDLAALRRRPAPAALGAVALAAGALALLAWYPLPGATGTAPAPVAARAPASGPVRPAASTGTTRILEFSDYECPFCAQVHETNKPLLARHPEVEVIRRHFPLDQACNPKITRPFHQNACEYARAAICAEAQGRFDAMDDLLFENAKVKAPVERLAAQAGLDLAQFRSCLASPGTEARLAADIQEGIRLGIRGTPSFVHDGRIVQGSLEQLLEGTAGTGGR